MSTEVKLGDLVRNFLKDQPLSDPDRKRLHDVFVSEVEQTIRKKYKIDLEKELNEEIREREIRNKIEGSKEIVWIAILLAFFVGLFCNQITEYISWALLNCVPGDFVGLARFFGCIVICLVIYIAYKSKYIDVIESYYEKRAKND